jgi:hypothetical protein
VHANHIKLQFDTLLLPEDSILPRDLLKGHPILGQQYWDTQVSGISIKTAVLAELEKLWQTI